MTITHDKIYTPDGQKIELLTPSPEPTGSDNTSSLVVQCNMIDGCAEAYQMSGSDIYCIKVLSHGLEPLKRMIGEIPDSLLELLLRAVNNRTVERNYFRLYGEMADGTISEEEFNREIEDHEERYVVVADQEPNEGTLRLALSLCRYIKDVNDTEDLSSLFSLDTTKLNALLTKLGEDDGLRKCE